MEGLPSLPFCEEFLIHIQPWPSHWPWPNARHGTTRAVGLFSVIQNCTNHGENEGSFGSRGCNLHKAFCWMQIKAWTLEVLASWYHRIASQKGWCNQCSRWCLYSNACQAYRSTYPSLLQVPSVVPSSLTGVFDSGPRKRTACKQRKMSALTLRFHSTFVCHHTRNISPWPAIHQVALLSATRPLPASPHHVVVPQNKSSISWVCRMLENRIQHRHWANVWGT